MKYTYKNLSRYLIYFIGLLLTPLAHAETTLFQGEPDVSKLTPSVKDSTLFVNAPTRSDKQTNLVSRAAGTNQYYSHYQMNPTETNGFVTKYWTVEDVKQGDGFPGISQGDSATIHGRGISYGGIFWPLELMTANNKLGQQVYYNKVDIDSIKYISGNLFPLQVGNDLKFYFTRTHQRILGDNNNVERDQGVMEFRVVKKFEGYPYSKTSVPGDIYTIEVWETTNNHPAKYLTDIYDYSNYFGWYITDRYYDVNNQLLATYHLQDWK
jgi:hypothetical protein